MKRDVTEIGLRLAGRETAEQFRDTRDRKTAGVVGSVREGHRHVTAIRHLPGAQTRCRGGIRVKHHHELPGARQDAGRQGEAGTEAKAGTHVRLQADTGAKRKAGVAGMQVFQAQVMRKGA